MHTPPTCCPSRGMTMWGSTAGRLLCWLCFQVWSSFCWCSNRSRSLSTFLWPSLSRSRLCWYSSNCSSNSSLSRLSLSASRWHCLSLSSSLLSCSPCWLSLAWHSLCQRSFSWRNRSWSRWAATTSSFRFSRFRCFSCSCRVLPRMLERCGRWARGDGRPVSWRRSFWTSKQLSWMVTVAWHRKGQAETWGGSWKCSTTLLTTSRDDLNSKIWRDSWTGSAWVLTFYVFGQKRLFVRLKWPRRHW